MDSEPLPQPHNTDSSPLEWLCSGWAWYRRWRGGHWERWMIDLPMHGEVWLRVEVCSERNGWRPGLGRGHPICKDHVADS